MNVFTKNKVRCNFSDDTILYYLYIMLYIDNLVGSFLIIYCN